MSDPIINWIKSTLQGRCLGADYGEAKVKGFVSNGYPQGAILFTLLWFQDLGPLISDNDKDKGFRII